MRVGVDGDRGAEDLAHQFVVRELRRVGDEVGREARLVELLGLRYELRRLREHVPQVVERGPQVRVVPGVADPRLALPHLDALVRLGAHVAVDPGFDLARVARARRREPRLEDAVELGREGGLVEVAPALHGAVEAHAVPARERALGELEPAHGPPDVRGDPLVADAVLERARVPEQVVDAHAAEVRHGRAHARRRRVRRARLRVARVAVERVAPHGEGAVVLLQARALLLDLVQERPALFFADLAPRHALGDDLRRGPRDRADVLDGDRGLELRALALEPRGADQVVLAVEHAQAPHLAERAAPDASRAPPPLAPPEGHVVAVPRLHEARDAGHGRAAPPRVQERARGDDLGEGGPPAPPGREVAEPPREGQAVGRPEVHGVEPVQQSDGARAEEDLGSAHAVAGRRDGQRPEHGRREAARVQARERVEARGLSFQLRRGLAVLGLDGLEVDARRHAAPEHVAGLGDALGPELRRDARAVEDADGHLVVRF